MIANSPLVIATIDGSSPGHRLQLVMVARDEGTQLELRQQSWAESVGWYTQSSVAVEPEQVAELRNSLGLGGKSARLRSQPASENAPSSHPLRIVG